MCDEARELHEAMRRQGISRHDDPWDLCPAEYRFRMELVVKAINDSKYRDAPSHFDSEAYRRGALEGFHDGSTKGEYGKH